MLGIVLVIVGFVLFHNGWFGLAKKPLDGKAASVVNFLGGAAICIIGLFTALDGAYFSAVIYLLVGLTYLYIGFDAVFGLDARPFGVFCLTGAIALFIGGALQIEAGLATLWDWWLLLCWLSWALLWFVLFVECAFEKKFGKFTPVFCLLTTVYTGWAPGIMLLAGWWGG